MAQGTGKWSDGWKQYAQATAADFADAQLRIQEPEYRPVRKLGQTPFEKWWLEMVQRQVLDENAVANDVAYASAHNNVLLGEEEHGSELFVRECYLQMEAVMMKEFVGKKRKRFAILNSPGIGSPASWRSRHGGSLRWRRP